MSCIAPMVFLLNRPVHRWTRWQGECPHRDWRACLSNPGLRPSLPQINRRASFSSYPGMLSSLDDFYVMPDEDQRLVMLQTTNVSGRPHIGSAATGMGGARHSVKHWSEGGAVLLLEAAGWGFPLECRISFGGSRCVNRAKTQAHQHSLVCPSSSTLPMSIT